MPLPVSSEQVAKYLDLVQHHARRLDGMHTAEYDDLVQEGSLAVFLALREGKHPSQDHVVHAMHHWINKCAQRGITYLPRDADLVLAEEQDVEWLAAGVTIMEVRHAAELP